MQKNKQITRTKMERALADIELDGPARIGGTVFQKGTPVLDLILYAQSEWQYKNGALEEKKPVDASTRDSWVHEMYRITTEYHVNTKKKVQIADLLETFFVTTMKEVELDDRPAFEARLRERLV